MVVWPAAYFLAALLPRIAMLLYGAVFADDLWHGPGGHMVSLRFLNAAELALWQAIFGKQFLLGPAVKIIVALYTAGFCIVLRASLLRWGAPAIVASVAPLLIPLHPIWNTFLGWNATGVYVLSLLFVALGYFWLSTDRTILGVIAVAIGLSGYQVHAGLLPALILIELVLRREGLRTLIRRAIACAAAGVLYGVAILVSGAKAWGDRGIGTSGGGSLRGMIDNLAAVTQPLLSFWLGTNVAWKWWRAPFVVFAIASRKLFWMPIAMPLLAAAVILPLNVVPTGPRVAGAIWTASVLSIVPLLARCSRNVVIAIALLFAAIAVPVSIADANRRVEAWRIDRAMMAALRKDASGHLIVLERTNVKGAATQQRPIVLQNFQPVTAWQHSNTVECPEWLFEYEGKFRVVESGGANWTFGGRTMFAEWHHDRAARVTRVRLFAPPS